MPHVIVKLWPGQPAASKQQLSDAIVASVTDILGYGADSVSVGFEEVSPADWMSQVYEPDITSRWTQLTKTPGYGTGSSH
ncbi:tautomerase family protein [Altererythrobacter sp. Z27]|uniref:tautomerase family protein n=1 Tax=Altererythrobacter sp. Z27 TaxID=3461147 RepID=UPI004043F858